jgi:hypothetical protein
MNELDALINQLGKMDPSKFSKFERQMMAAIISLLVTNNQLLTELRTIQTQLQITNTQELKN